jgi:tetratricopeptide (TPR) repeat protein
MRTLILASVVAACVWPTGAHADDQDLGRAHFTTGRSYYDQGRYADALKEFEEAYRVSKRVGFLYNIGICHEKLGHDEEALTAFQGYLGSVADEAERAELQSHIDAIKARRASRVPATATPAPTSNALTAMAPPPARERPVWKRGWFWGTMAAVAAVVATGVAVGVVLGTADHGLRTLPDVRLQ